MARLSSGFVDLVTMSLAIKIHDSRRLRKPWWTLDLYALSIVGIT